MCNSNTDVKSCFSGFEQSRIETDLMKNATTVSNETGSNNDDLKGLRIGNAKHVLKDMPCGSDISSETSNEVITEENLLLTIKRNMPNEGLQGKVKNEEETCNYFPVNKNIMRNFLIENAHVDKGIHNHLPGERIKEYSMKEVTDYYAESSEFKQSDVSVKGMHCSTDVSHVEKYRKIESPPQKIQKPAVNFVEESGKNVNNTRISSKIHPLTSAILPVCQNSSCLGNRQEYNCTVGKKFFKQLPQKNYVWVSPKKNYQSSIEEKGLFTDVKLKAHENIQKLILKPVSVIIKRSAYLESYIKENKINSSIKNNKKIDAYKFLNDESLSIKKKESLVDESQAKNQVLKKEITYSCSICFFSTTEEGQFTHHIKEHPVNMLTSWCKECHKMFRNFKGLLHHIQSKCSGSFGRRIKCGVTSCSFETKSPQQFYHHNRFKHRGALKLNCSTCDKFFSTPQCLVLHVQDECLKNVDNQLKENSETIKCVEKGQNCVSEVLNDSPGKLHDTEKISDEIAGPDRDCQKDTSLSSTLAIDSEDNPDDPEWIPESVSYSDSSSVGDNIERQAIEKETIAVKSLNSSVKSQNIIHTSLLQSESKSIPTTLVLNKCTEVEHTGSCGDFPTIQPSASKGNLLLNHLLSVSPCTTKLLVQNATTSKQLLHVHSLASTSTSIMNSNLTNISTTVKSQVSPDHNGQYGIGNNAFAQMSAVVQDLFVLPQLNNTVLLQTRTFTQPKNLFVSTPQNYIRSCSPQPVFVSGSSVLLPTSTYSNSTTATLKHNLVPLTTNSQSLQVHPISKTIFTTNEPYQKVLDKEMTFGAHSSTTDVSENSSKQVICKKSETPTKEPNNNSPIITVHEMLSKVSCPEDKNNESKEIIIIDDSDSEEKQSNEKTMMYKEKWLSQKTSNIYSGNMIINRDDDLKSNCDLIKRIEDPENLNDKKIQNSSFLETYENNLTEDFEHGKVVIDLDSDSEQNDVMKNSTCEIPSLDMRVEEDNEPIVLKTLSTELKNHLLPSHLSLSLDVEEENFDYPPSKLFTDKADLSSDLVVKVINFSDGEEYRTHFSERTTQLKENAEHTLSSILALNVKQCSNSTESIKRTNLSVDYTKDSVKQSSNERREIRDLLGVCVNTDCTERPLEKTLVSLHSAKDTFINTVAKTPQTSCASPLPCQKTHVPETKAGESKSVHVHLDRKNYTESPKTLENINTKIPNPAKSIIQEDSLDKKHSVLQIPHCGKYEMVNTVIKLPAGEIKLKEPFFSTQENAGKLHLISQDIENQKLNREVDSDNILTGTHFSCQVTEKSELDELYSSEQSSQVTTVGSRIVSSQVIPLQETAEKLSPAVTVVSCNFITQFMNSKFPCVKNSEILQKSNLLQGISSNQKVTVEKPVNQNEVCKKSHTLNKLSYILPKVPKVGSGFPTFLISSQVSSNHNANSNNILTGLHSYYQVREKSKLFQLDKLLSSKQPSQVATVGGRRVSSPITSPLKTAEKVSPAVTSVLGNSVTPILNPKFPCVRTSSTGQKQIELPRFSLCQKSNPKKAFNQNGVHVTSSIVTETANAASEMSKVDASFSTLLTPSQVCGKYHTALYHKPLQNTFSDSLLIQNGKRLSSCHEIPIAPALPATSRVGEVGNSHERADTSSKHIAKVISDKHKQWENYLYSLKSTEAVYEILKEENNVKFFKCTDKKCFFTTDNSTQYEEHLKIHKDENLPCPYCFVIFKATKLTEHVLKKHWKLRYQCSYCWYRGWGKAHVRTHTRKAHPEKPLKMLTGIVLEGEDSDEDTPDYSEVTKPYLCALGTCGFSTFDLSEFKKHYNTTHKTVSIFPCYYCKTEVISFEKLLKHLKLHGINSFQCTFCLHGTETQEKILDHMTSAHPNKPLQLYVRGSVISSEKNTSGFLTSNSFKELTVSECTSIQPQLEHSNKNSELGSSSNFRFSLPRSKDEYNHKHNFVIHDPTSQRKKKSARFKNVTTGSMVSRNKHVPVSETISLLEEQMKQNKPDNLFSDEILMNNEVLKEAKLTPCSSSGNMLNELKNSKNIMNCSESNEEERGKNLNIKSIGKFKNIIKKSLTLQEEYDRSIFPEERKRKIENKINILRESKESQQCPLRSLNSLKTVGNSETFEITPFKSVAEEESNTTEEKQKKCNKLNFHSWALDTYKTPKHYSSTEAVSENDEKVLDHLCREQEILPDDNFSENDGNCKTDKIVYYSDRCIDKSYIYQHHETYDECVNESCGNIIKSNTSENTVYVCTLCSAKMYKHDSIVHHLQTVHCTQYCRCKYCSLSGTSLVTLIKHSLKCHKDKKPKLVLLYQKIKQEIGKDLFEKEIKLPAGVTNKENISSEEQTERELSEVNAERSVSKNSYHALKRKLEMQNLNSKNAETATEDEFQNTEYSKLEKENKQRCHVTNISENEDNLTVKSNFQNTHGEFLISASDIACKDIGVTDVGKFFADDTLIEVQHNDLYTCLFCNSANSSFCIQKLHMFQELNYYRLLCLACGMHCFNIKEIEDHFQKHHPDEKLSYQQKCDINTERLVELFLISQKKIRESKVSPLSLKQTLVSLKQSFENCHHEKKQTLLLSCEKAIAALEECQSLHERETKFLFDENGGGKSSKVEILEEERTGGVSDLYPSLSICDAIVPKIIVDQNTSQFSSITIPKEFSDSDLDVFKKESVVPVAESNFENKDENFSGNGVQKLSENISAFNTECSRSNKTKQSFNSARRTLSMLKKAQTKISEAKVILFTCPFCEYTQTSYHYQKLHIYRELKYRKMLCLVCKMKCFNMKELKTHFRKHHPDHKINFEWLRDIDTEQWVENLLRSQCLSQKPNHRLKSRPKERIKEYKYVCIVCGAKQRDTTDLQRHLFRHKQYRPVKCCHCNKKFICSTDAERHSEKLHPGLELCCSISRLDSIEDWVNEIIGSQQSCNQHDTEVECATYLKKRNSEGSEVLVKKSMQVKNNGFNCQWENCKFYTDNKKKLKYHLMIHFSKSEFSCPNCLVSFNSEAKLKSHCEISHSKKLLTYTAINSKTSINKNNSEPKKCFNKFTCHYCGHSVYSKKGLRIHIQWKHQKEFEKDENVLKESSYDIAVTSHPQTFSHKEPFECEWCGIRLVELREILEHIKSHDDKISKSTVLSIPVSSFSSGNNQKPNNHADVEGVKETNSSKLSLFDQVCHKISGISYSDIHLASDELPVKNILESVKRCAYCRKNMPSDTIKQHCRKQHPNLPVKIIKHHPKATYGSPQFFRNSEGNRTIEKLKLENKNILLGNSGEHLYLCDNEPYRCEYCPAQVSSVRNLHKHWQKEHQTKSLNHSSNIGAHGLTQEQSIMSSPFSNILEKLQIQNSARKLFTHLVDSQLQKNAENRKTTVQESNAVDDAHPNIFEPTCIKRRLSQGSDNFTCDSLSEGGFSMYRKKQKLDTSNIKVNIPSLGAKIPYQSVLHLCNLQPCVMLTDLKSQLFNFGVF
ncbi:uncharacterized protein LOC143240438 [Tachypleus tridentatus]|uniref:uncharacterized protein LOC143240438 n=1 Tax=Tachypleus tridentatus TaxID=6853 RepID=UPI003FD1E122